MTVSLSVEEDCWGVPGKVIGAGTYGLNTNLTQQSEKTD
jgi:hypothetical protein